MTKFEGDKEHSWPDYSVILFGGEDAQKPFHFFSKNEEVFFMPKPFKRAWGYRKQDYFVILFGGCCSKTFPFFFQKMRRFFLCPNPSSELGVWA